MKKPLHASVKKIDRKNPDFSHFAHARQMGPNHASAPDDEMENDETQPYRKKNDEEETEGDSEDDVPEKDEMEKELEQMRDDFDEEKKGKNGDKKTKKKD